MIGIMLGFSSAICFAGSAIMFKVGQRARPTDNGLFVSVLVNVLFLAIVAFARDWPRWSASGIVAFLLAGVLGTVGGRNSNLRAIRSIGPSRANAFLTANPVVSAIVGWLVLGETLGLQEFVGGALVLIGLMLLIRSQSRPMTVAPSSRITAGYFWALAAPVFFGLAFVARKWGLERLPDPAIGAFLGVAAAFLVISAAEAQGRRLGETVRGNLVQVSWWYVAAGVFTSLALLAQFSAFAYLPAWVVGLLHGTQALWTLLLGWLFLRQEELIDRRLVGVIFLVMVGVTLIGLEV